MSRALSEIQRLAQSLITHETKGKSSASNTPAAFLVCEKLRPQLATLMGNAGFSALLSRSLALASAEVVWLRGVHVKADGSLEVLDEAEARGAVSEMPQDEAVLVAQLLGLLAAFIGEGLTVQLVDEIWPKVSSSRKR